MRRRVQRPTIPTVTPRPSLDTILLDSPSARAGSFWCRAQDPWFSDTGPIEQFLIYFPRHAVWIKHDSGHPFVADLQVATIYNRGQLYRRKSIASCDDRGDWYALSEEVTREIVARFDTAGARHPTRPFRFEFAPIDSALFLRQRALSQQLRALRVDRLQAEEAIFDLMCAVIRNAYRARDLSRRGARSVARQSRLVSRTKAVLLERCGENVSITELARAVNASPYHLCRTFRAHTGQSLHQYRVQHRLRASLERVIAGERSLSGVAADVGFASHAHYTSVFRRQWSVTPSALRRTLADDAHERSP